MDDPLLSGKPQQFLPNPQNKSGMLSWSSLNERKWSAVWSCTKQCCPKSQRLCVRSAAGSGHSAPSHLFLSFPASFRCYPEPFPCCEGSAPCLQEGWVCWGGKQPSSICLAGVAHLWQLFVQLLVAARLPRDWLGVLKSRQPWSVCFCSFTAKSEQKW